MCSARSPSMNAVTLHKASFWGSQNRGPLSWCSEFLVCPGRFVQVVRVTSAASGTTTVYYLRGFREPGIWKRHSSFLPPVTYEASAGKAQRLGVADSWELTSSWCLARAGSRRDQGLPTRVHTWASPCNRTSPSMAAPAAYTSCRTAGWSTCEYSRGRGGAGIPTHGTQHHFRSAVCCQPSHEMPRFKKR